MIKATYLVSLFLTGCVASSFVGMLATTHPVFYRAAMFLLVLTLFSWILGWVLDDWIIAQFRLDRRTYYAGLVLSGLAVLLGLGVMAWTVF